MVKAVAPMLEGVLDSEAKGLVIRDPAVVRMSIDAENWQAFLEFIELDVSKMVLGWMKRSEPVVGRPRFEGDPGSDDWRAWRKSADQYWGAFEWFSKGKSLGALDDTNIAVVIIVMLKTMGNYGDQLSKFLQGYVPPDWMDKP